jgi:hypothetical protein
MHARSAHDAGSVLASSFPDDRHVCRALSRADRVRVAVGLCEDSDDCERGESAGNPMSGYSHWQLDPTLILLGNVTAGQKGWGARGSNPEPTD